MEEKHDIVIVGAGIAGLGAALELTQNGYSVLLIESQDRVGGRIKTINLDGSTVEAGANYRELQLGNPLDPFLSVCEQVENKRNSIKFYKHGKELDLFDQAFKFGKFKKYLSYAKKFLEKNNIRSKEDLENFNIKSIQDLINASIPSSGLGSIFLDNPADALDVLSICNNSWFANTLDKIPPVYMLDENENQILFKQLSLTFDFTSGKRVYDIQVHKAENEKLENKMVLGGYDKVCQEILKKIETNPGNFKLLLNSTVNKIDTSNPDQCVIQYTKEGENNTVYCNRVISTLPLGVMKYIAKEKPDFFNPPLPVEKCEALSRTEPGIMNKIILKFDEVFWSKGAQFIYTRSRNNNTMHEWVNLYSYSVDTPILIVNYVGDEARFGVKSDDQIVASAMDELREIYGKKIPEPKCFHVTHWDKDPNSLGSWRTPNFNSKKGDLKTIAENSGSLYFAGEHIAFYGPNVHGAFISGTQTADDVINNLSYQKTLNM